jgi:type I restriction enzyme S subunit
VTPDRANAEFWSDGSVPWLNSGSVNDGTITTPSELITPAAATGSSTRWAHAGSVLIALAGQGKTKGMAARLEMSSTFNQSMAAIVPRASLLDYRYLQYWLGTNYQPIRNMAGGDLRDGLNLKHIGAIQTLLPPLRDQHSIADFLDRETAEIDAFIADQEKLVGLLAERRAATIRHAVTKGLDPNVPMKDSGVEWLGKVPAAWEVTRLSRFFTVTLGKMLDAGKDVPPASSVLPYVRAANIQESGITLESVNEMPFTIAESLALDIRKNDLLVVEGGAIGVNVHIEADMAGWSFQKTVNRLRPTNRGSSSQFLGFALDALRWNGVIDMIANKSTIAHLTAEKLERLVLAFPPTGEQRTIVDFLVNENAELDAAIADAHEAISLSRERRSALISAAVTGKIDVRGHGAVA